MQYLILIILIIEYIYMYRGSGAFLRYIHVYTCTYDKLSLYFV